jgi:hypothetical protein
MAAGTEEPFVSPKRAIALLKEAPDKLDLLLRWCPEKDAARILPNETETIRSIVGRLGTLDRHHFLESVKRFAAEDRPAIDAIAAPGAFAEIDLADVELAELLTRFRHVRAQSTGFLEDLPHAVWDRVGDDSGIGPLTLGRLITIWVGHDAAAFTRLNAISAELNKT